MKKHLLFLLSTISTVSFLSAQNLSRGPYLQNPTATSIIVRWRTDSPTDSKVQYGLTYQNLTSTKTDATQTTEHSVTITGLQTYTTYYYKVGNSSTFFTTAGADFTFKTFPGPNTSVPTRVWAIGDFGKANDRQRRVRDAFVNFDNERKTNIWIWLGDNAYADGTDAEYQTKIFDSTYSYQKLFSRLPFHPAPGNHDYNSVSPIFNTTNPLTQTGNYLDVIDVPQNGENGGTPSGMKQFYSFDYGDVHFISFNTELASLSKDSDDWLGIGANADSNFARSPMRKWLIQDLQQNTKRWTIVYFHQPPHTAGSHVSSSPIEVQGKAIRIYWAPLFEQYGVDIVIAGHSHVYERSFLMNGFFQTWDKLTPAMIMDSTVGSLASGKPYRKSRAGTNANKGTVYIVNGNSGSSETNPPFTCPIMFAEDGCDECVGSTIFDIHNDTLTSRYLTGNQVIYDEFSIIKTDFPNAVSKIDETNPTVFQVYPNPATSTLSISIKDAKPYSLTMTDILGRKVWEQAAETAATETTLTLNLKDLGIKKGEYLLSKCGNANECNTQKILVK